MSCLLRRPGPLQSTELITAKKRQPRKMLQFRKDYLLQVFTGCLAVSGGGGGGRHSMRERHIYTPSTFLPVQLRHELGVVPLNRYKRYLEALTCTPLQATLQEDTHHRHHTR